MITLEDLTAKHHSILAQCEDPMDWMCEGDETKFLAAMQRAGWDIGRMQRALVLGYLYATRLDSKPYVIQKDGMDVTLLPPTEIPSLSCLLDGMTATTREEERQLKAIEMDLWMKAHSLLHSRKIDYVS